MMADSDPAPSTASRRNLRKRYPGTRSFEEEDETRFFGRPRATEELLLRVRSVRLLLQFAPSGAGKTSILNAGLFPKLRPHHFFPFIIRLNQVEESLTQSTTRALKAAAIKNGLKDPIIPENAKSLWALLADTQLWSDDLLLLTPVLVFDQFEEVFTLRDEAFRKAFASEVGELSRPQAHGRTTDHSPDMSDVQAPNVKIIISLREEYLGKLEEFSSSIPDLFHERLRLCPLTVDEAIEAIVEPARLGGDAWLSPPFEFAPECVGELIDFIDGASDRVKVIEPLTLQLVCQKAESIAQGRGWQADRTKLTIDDFGGWTGLERLVQNHFKGELDKLKSGRIRKQALAMFEDGLLDPEGKRLMLEQGEIERSYGLDVATLNQLVNESGLLRREPRNESVFYEISHDRLTDAIAKNRTPKLPRWVKPAILAGSVLMAAVIAVAIFLNAERARTEAQRQRAEHYVELLLGEDLVSRLREAGLTDALQVLNSATTDELSNSSANVSKSLALRLRHQGDIFFMRGTVKDARESFTSALAVIDTLTERQGEGGSDLLAERARVLQGLGELFDATGEIAKAEQQFAKSVQIWDQIVAANTGAMLALEAADARIKLGALRQRTGPSELAEPEFAEAARLALKVLTETYDYVQLNGDTNRDGFFLLGEALRVYADAASYLAGLWLEASDESEIAAVVNLAREALRLRPLSFLARAQLGVETANGASAVRASQSALPLALFRESERQFEELVQTDPNNLLLQRESAALRVLIAQETAECWDNTACKKTITPETLEEAELSTLQSIGIFRWLARLDTERRSLQSDISWGLQTRARLLDALGSPAEALSLIDEAIRVRRAGIDANDVGGRLSVMTLLTQKAQILEKQGKPLEAIAALDESLAEAERLPEKQLSVVQAHMRLLDAKIKLLESLKQADDAKQELETKKKVELLNKGPETPRTLASAADKEGVAFHNQANGLAGTAAVQEYRRALDKYKLAIETYPLSRAFWDHVRVAHAAIAQVEKEINENGDATVSGAVKSDAGASRPDAQETALRGALVAAWMARILSTGSPLAAESWRHLYDARINLARFLDENGRADEALALATQGVLDAEEYARQEPEQPGLSSGALDVLRAANVSLGIARWRADRVGGWEEALRRGIAYGERLAKREPASAAHQNWVGEHNVELASDLDQAMYREAAVEQYKLALQACRQALRLAKGAAPEHERAQSCLDDLEAVGYK